LPSSKYIFLICIIGFACFITAIDKSLQILLHVTESITLVSVFSNVTSVAFITVII